MTDETTPEQPPAMSETGDTAVLDGDKPKKLKQAVEFKDVGPCKKHIKVTIERDDIQAKLNEKYSELVSDADPAHGRPGAAVPLRLSQHRRRSHGRTAARSGVLCRRPGPALRRRHLPGGAGPARELVGQRWPGSLDPAAGAPGLKSC